MKVLANYEPVSGNITFTTGYSYMIGIGLNLEPYEEPMQIENTQISYFLTSDMLAKFTANELIDLKKAGVLI